MRGRPCITGSAIHTGMKVPMYFRKDVDDFFVIKQTVLEWSLSKRFNCSASDDVCGSTRV